MNNPFSIKWLSWRGMDWYKHQAPIKFQHPARLWFKLYLFKVMIEFYIPTKAW